MIFLLIASAPNSLLNFRGAFIDTLIKKGFHVHVASPELPAGCPMRERLEDKGIQVHNIPLSRTGMSPHSDVWTFIHAWRLMRKIRPAYVLAYTIKPVIYGALAARLAHVPVFFALITGLGYAFQEDKQRSSVRSLARVLYRIALKKVNKVFFQNPDDEALFRKVGILSESVPSCVINGSGVDVSKFSVVEIPNATHFLLIARLLGSKGVREYAEAARRIRAERPDIVFSLVGSIDKNPDAIQQHDLDAWVKDDTLKFAGRLTDVRPAIAECSVYVLPSYREGTPRTVLEAMAMGRAIISTDAPGCRETVIHGDNGYLVAVKSVDALVEAMQRFIQEPTLARRMGSRSRKIAEAKYDVHKVNATMLHEMGISECEECEC